MKTTVSDAVYMHEVFVAINSRNEVIAVCTTREQTQAFVDDYNCEYNTTGGKVIMCSLFGSTK